MAAINEQVRIPLGDVVLDGELVVPDRAGGIVLFAHGSGSSRHSPRNKFVAGTIRDAGIGTLLFDLLTADEEAVDNVTRHLRFDIGMLARRLAGAAEWVVLQPGAGGMGIGFFGSSTGGGAALVAAAELGHRAGAVVSRGGRPDLAGEALARVTAPTLLIVGERDEAVIGMNKDAMRQMHCKTALKIVPGASHLFEEPGTLEQVAMLAADWFAFELGGRADAVGK